MVLPCWPSEFWLGRMRPVAYQGSSRGRMHMLSRTQSGATERRAHGKARSWMCRSLSTGGFHTVSEVLPGNSPHCSEVRQWHPEIGLATLPAIPPCANPPGASLHPFVTELCRRKSANEASGWCLTSSAISTRASSVRPSWADRPPLGGPLASSFAPPV